MENMLDPKIAIQTLYMSHILHFKYSKIGIQQIIASVIFHSTKEKNAFYINQMLAVLEYAGQIKLATWVRHCATIYAPFTIKKNSYKKVEMVLGLYSELKSPVKFSTTKDYPTYLTSVYATINNLTYEEK